MHRNIPLPQFHQNCTNSLPPVIYPFQNQVTVVTKCRFKSGSVCLYQEHSSDWIHNDGPFIAKVTSTLKKIIYNYNT